MTNRLSAAEECPHAVPDGVPLWSENYAFDGHDPEARVGFFLHLGLSRMDPTLWEELVEIHLPSGEHLVARSFGRAVDRTVAAAANLFFRCEEPWRRWRLSYRAPARRVRPEELLAGGLREGAEDPVDFDVVFEAAGPVWDMGHEGMKDQVFAKFHYEQAGRVQGRLRWGERDLHLSGVAYRDHSVGPRDLVDLSHSCWTHGLFPSGRQFGLFTMTTGPEGRDARLGRAFVSDGRVLREAEVIDAAPLRSVEMAREPYAIRLRVEGREVRIAAEVSSARPCSFRPPNDMFLGVPRDLATHVCFHSMTRFTWDQEVGHGFTERTLPLRQDS